MVGDIDEPVLAAEDAHHLERVLRLRPGVALTLGDGRGSWRDAQWRGNGQLDVTGAVIVDAPPIAIVAVGFALVKGGKPELVVQKLTELGVDRIVPFIAERSVVRWVDERSGRNAARLAKVARSATMQSKRAWLPVVEPVVSFDEVVGESGAAIADVGGEPMPWPVGIILVGPEGGWSDAERARAGRRVGLGLTVLRAETAAIAVGVLATAMRADHARPVA